ncbi:ribosome small subunit-dependent GTPase A [Bacillus cereus]|uniref:ribosome small subunit-dependent GTPase A n=1 Tax=Bacillus cereus TaxID=1396 RepID=UPI000995BD18|nr:ribosome small subunit-dependent GTPase A [Bacillus cereus]MCM3218520.1 ribosome small subunit-dependent GTPase A [Bacillus cereus]MCU4929758.1 ribosome small subunit-dependent GTPase A [Bacillus cereus]OPA08999.1 ribosome small subunit-dependent GTPase A [Bacillus cereus]OPA19396.1 ribosome small subunit-dependent GTPase A [Bacillus cereus]TKH30167.1 ribosome small subunit-dependent GTPase A [Bacillus cereus]
MKQNILESFGWDSFFEEQVTEKNYEVGRILLEHKHIYRIICNDGEYMAELSGKFRHEAVTKGDYPAVGDWVYIKKIEDEKKAIIHRIFQRRSSFSRQEAGTRTEEQIIAANVDYLFLVNALNHDFNVRRMERYLLLAYESGAMPVIVLTKSSICNDIEQKIVETEAIAIGVPIFVVDSLEHTGIDSLKQFVSSGKTIALVGSSGVGKSTLLNALIGIEVAKTGDIREEDSRGRHTTTHRELFQLPSGALVIDTPGMRELQLWEGSEAIQTTFSDIEELATTCRFRDCKHENEPGCAVYSAIENGLITIDRLKSYKKLQRELAYFIRKQDAILARAERDKWRKISKQHKKM